MVWLCDQEPVRTFQKGPLHEKAKLRRWWAYLSQLRLTVHHIQGVKNECADPISPLLGPCCSHWPPARADTYPGVCTAITVQNKLLKWTEIMYNILPPGPEVLN